MFRGVGEARSGGDAATVTACGTTSAQNVGAASALADVTCKEGLMTRRMGHIATASRLALALAAALVGAAGAPTAHAAGDRRDHDAQVAARETLGSVQSIGRGGTTLVIKVRTGQDLAFEVPAAQAGKVSKLRKGEHVDVRYVSKDGKLVVQSVGDHH
jgi:hypothetical protein